MRAPPARPGVGHPEDGEANRPRNAGRAAAASPSLPPADERWAMVPGLIGSERPVSARTIWLLLIAGATAIAAVLVLALSGVL